MKRTVSAGSALAGKGGPVLAGKGGPVLAGKGGPALAGKGGPVLAVVGAAALLWALSGVAVGDALLFVVYHAIFVIAPGWLVYRLLRPGDSGRLRQLVFGWALGYVLEVLAFIATAAAGQRELLVGYPVVIFALSGMLWSRRVEGRWWWQPHRPGGWQPTGAVTLPGAATPAGWSWAVAAICCLALAFVGIEYFASAPLPNHVTRVSYGIDTVWYLSLAGEALHHWPVADPTVYGEPLYYHLFSSFDPAAVTQVTGIDLSVVFLRLYIVPMVILAVLGLCLAGRSFGGPWAGPVAAVLALFVGELNLDPHVGYRFANEIGDDVLAISPSFLIGAALFAPLLALLCELTGDGRLRKLPCGKLAVFGLLVAGATGSKAPLPTVLAGGLAVYLVWHAIRRREFHRPLVAVLALTLGAFALFWLFSYRGAGSDQLTLQPPGAIRQMDAVTHVLSGIGASGAWQPLLWVAMSLVGIVGAYGAQLAGLLAARGAAREPAAGGGGARSDRRVSLRRENAALLLSLFAFGQVPYLLFTHPGLSEVFFSEYGLLAACLVSAEGIRRLWLRTAPRRGMVAFTAGAGALAVALSLSLASLLGGRGGPRAIYLDIDFGLAAALGLAYLVALLRRRAGGVAWAYVAAGALAVGLTGRMVTVLAPTARQLAAGRPLYSQVGPALTAGIYRALLWVRKHSSPSAVLAVNNIRDWSLYWTDGWAVPDDFNYSAFAQRPTFLEGYIYTQAAAEASPAAYYGHQLLFRNRIALNNAIFQWAHADALRTAARHFGVRYLLVDRVHNRANPMLGRIAHLVYSNRDAAVYAVPRSAIDPPPRPRRAKPGRRLGRSSCRRRKCPSARRRLQSPRGPADPSRK